MHLFDDKKDENNLGKENIFVDTVGELVLVESVSVMGSNLNGLEQGSLALINVGLADVISFSQKLQISHVLEDAVDGSTNSLLDNEEKATSFSLQAASVLAPIIKDKYIPLVIGGDDSILLGVAEIISKSGQIGLFWCGGPALEPPNSTQTNNVSLSIRNTILGVESVNRLNYIKTHINAEQVVLFGIQPSELNAEIAEFDDVREAEKLTFDTAELRSFGVENSLDDACSRLLVASSSGFWVHLSCDVLGSLILSGTDTSTDFANTLDITDVMNVLKSLKATQKMLGLSISNYNPNLDQNGDGARALISMLGAVLI